MQRPEAHQRHDILKETDIVVVRRACRDLAKELELNLVTQTKLVTAASELARNTFTHGGGGCCLLDLVTEGPRRGLRMQFTDEGPGIANINQALTDGFSTGSGLGLGLGGARRLVSDFQIESSPGSGTTVTITQWT